MSADTPLQESTPAVSSAAVDDFSSFLSAPAPAPAPAAPPTAAPTYRSAEEDSFFNQPQQGSPAPSGKLTTDSILALYGKSQPPPVAPSHAFPIQGVNSSCFLKSQLKTGNKPGSSRELGTFEKQFFRLQDLSTDGRRSADRPTSHVIFRRQSGIGWRTVRNPINSQITIYLKDFPAHIMDMQCCTGGFMPVAPGAGFQQSPFAVPNGMIPSTQIPVPVQSGMFPPMGVAAPPTNINPASNPFYNMAPTQPVPVSYSTGTRMVRHGKTSFQDHWLLDPDCKNWVRRAAGDIYSTTCLFYPGTLISVSTMGRQALVSHSKSKKHMSKANAEMKQPNIGAYLRTKVRESELATTSKSSMINANVPTTSKSSMINESGPDLPQAEQVSLPKSSVPIFVSRNKNDRFGHLWIAYPSLCIQGCNEFHGLEYSSLSACPLQLFQGPASSRGSFTKHTGSTKFPLKFCAVTWLENADVAERAINILPDLRKYVQSLDQNNLISIQTAERAQKEFKKLCLNKDVIQKMKSFKRVEDVEKRSGCQKKELRRLDHFWIRLVERRFSINKECLIENMNEDSLVAARTIFNAVSVYGEVEKVPICKKILLSASNSYSMYKEHLLEEKKKTTQETAEKESRKRNQILVRKLELKKGKFLKMPKRNVKALCGRYLRGEGMVYRSPKQLEAIENRFGVLEASHGRMEQGGENTENKLAGAEQHSCSNNLESNDIPLTPREDVYSVLQLARIINMKRVKEEWRLAAWKKRNISAAEISTSFPDSSVSLNEHLTGHKAILGRAKSLQRQESTSLGIFVTNMTALYHRYGESNNFTINF
ncbi:hypothetical protein J6590_070021 [Homalodisca vitripennis]|nr:hypothetical protein J6590_070021 [Homalodisca vitripennis]